MNLFVFLIRGSTGLFFLAMFGMSIDPKLSNSNPDWHANFVAAVASLFLATLYFWPLIAAAKNGNVKTRMPTARSFTPERVLTFGRWSLAFILGVIIVSYFLELQFICGALSMVPVVCMMPPVDRLMFAPAHEMTARLKSDATVLKIIPGLAVFITFSALGFFGQKNYTGTIYILLVSIALLLVLPIVLFAKGGLKALSLKRTVPPASVPEQSLETLLSKLNTGKTPQIPRTEFSQMPRTTAPSFSQRRIRHKYYSAKAWHWNWPVPKELQRYPLNEQGFNMLINGFEVSWLESKKYHERLKLHRDPPTFIKEIIAEAEAYIESMWLRPELLARNKPMSLGLDPVRFVPDEVSKVWKADKRLRSLYYATQRFAQTPNKQAIMPFRAIVPHIAEYRAMINVIKHLRHSLNRMIVSTPIVKPKQAADNVPVVFISYSWDSREHEEWVINLATKLRENGVDAILDKWDLGLLGKLLPHFMETSISRSHRVICIMTPNYKKKTENLAGGVGYEYSIITAEIFTDSINTSKFIPLFRSGTDTDAIPAALKGRKYVDMRDDTQFDEKFIHELLRDIHDEPKAKKPAIGKKPEF